MRTIHAIFPPFILLLALALPACELPKSPPALGGAGMDMFAPVALHIHHLSRILSSAATMASAPATAASPALEALIELSDQFKDSTGKGDTAKGAGIFRLELFDQSPLSPKGPLLQAWSIPITTPQDHQAYWDRITRTYTFRLPLNRLPKNRERLLLVTTLTLPNGSTLQDEYEVPVK